MFEDIKRPTDSLVSNSLNIKSVPKYRVNLYTQNRNKQTEDKTNWSKLVEKEPLSILLHEENSLETILIVDKPFSVTFETKMSNIFWVPAT